MLALVATPPVRFVAHAAVHEEAVLSFALQLREYVLAQASAACFAEFLEESRCFREANLVAEVARLRQHVEPHQPPAAHFVVVQREAARGLRPELGDNDPLADATE